MSAAPELQIRRYLEQQGGNTEATLEQLLVTFGFNEGDERGRVVILEALSSAGVRVDRPLDGLDIRNPLALSLVAPVTAPPPPWLDLETAGPSPSQQARGNSRKGARVVAILAVLLAAAGAAVAGYLLAEQSGVDLDRARADGMREARRLAEARVDPVRLSSSPGGPKDRLPAGLPEILC